MSRVLIIVCGRPAVGKTTLARELAGQLAAVYLRIDTVEQAVVRSGVAERPLGPVGYTVAHAVAADQLRLRLTVVAECVNPLAVTRDGWQGLARDLRVPLVEAEIVCSDPDEHRNRVAHRTVDIPGLHLPDWDEIAASAYEPWDRERVVVDTAHRDVDACVSELRARIADHCPSTGPSGSL